MTTRDSGSGWVFFVVVFSKIHQKSFLKRGMWDRVHHCFALLANFFFVIKIKYRNLPTGYFFFLLVPPETPPVYQTQKWMVHFMVRRTPIAIQS